MNENGTGDLSISLDRETVDQYFAMKTLQAARNGNEELLHFLEASQRSWENNGILSVRFMEDIARWEEKTRLLNDLIDAPSAKKPSRWRVKFPRSRRPARYKALHLALYSVITVPMFVFLAVSGLDIDTTIPLSVCGLIWLYFALDALASWRQERR